MDVEAFSANFFHQLQSLAFTCCFVSNKIASSKKLKVICSSDKECRCWYVALETALLESWRRDFSKAEFRRGASIAWGAVNQASTSIALLYQLFYSFFLLSDDWWDSTVLETSIVLKHEEVYSSSMSGTPPRSTKRCIVRWNCSYKGNYKHHTFLG